VTSATGWISLAVDHLRASIANSATFQTWTGSVDAATALNRVGYRDMGITPADGIEYVAGELASLMPCAIVSIGPQMSLKSDADGTWSDGGSLVAEFWDQADESVATDISEVERRFSNQVGTIVREVCQQNRTAGRLDVSAATSKTEPMRATPQDKTGSLGDWVYWAWDFPYGPQ
jgi:hypothetical protein